MRFDHLQRKGGGDRGIEGAAALQIPMPTAVAPMSRGDDAERASISGRVVKGLGLILAAIFRRARVKGRFLCCDPNAVKLTK
jgi:hypothetical protein